MFHQEFAVGSTEMHTLPFARERALVLGLGDSGLAMARWCALQGAQVTVLDSREHPPRAQDLREGVNGALLYHSAFPTDSRAAEALLQVLESSDQRAFSILLLSPGLAPVQTQALVNHFRGRGLWVTGELGLFEHALSRLKQACAYVPKVIGVTGTNGKTTVTQLCKHLLIRSGLDAVAAGNVGDCMLDVLRQRLQDQRLPNAWVLELSSFQLHANELHADAATVLNVTEDHLDWHSDFTAYADSKARVFAGARLGLGVAVVNRDDPAVLTMLNAQGSLMPAQTPTGRSMRGVAGSTTDLRHVSFGAGVPERNGDFGIERVNGLNWLVRAVQADDSQKKKSARAVPDLHLQRLMPADALRIRGLHNALNALAAIALCTAVGMPMATMLYGLREYAGEPHRCVSVAIVRGVEYVNDSKGTNVGATLAAIKSVGSDRDAGKLIMILGGVAKGQDFRPMSESLQRYARAVVLLGKDAKLIEDQLCADQQTGVGVAKHHAGSLQEAVQMATSLAQAGDVVLLSPACASFDMFKGYADRGEQFEAIVAEFASTGQVA